VLQTAFFYKIGGLWLPSIRQPDPPHLNICPPLSNQLQDFQNFWVKYNPHFLEQRSSKTILLLLLDHLKHYSPLQPWLPMQSSSVPDGLWPFPACLFISIIFKSSSTLSLHLLHDLPLFLVPSIVTVAISFAFFQHDHTILIRGLLQRSKINIPTVIFLLCVCVGMLTYNNPTQAWATSLLRSHTYIPC
jgi:hypothetical protein